MPGMDPIIRRISGSAIMRWWTAGSAIRRSWAAWSWARRSARSAGDMSAIRSRIRATSAARASASVGIAMPEWSTPCIWPWSMSEWSIAGMVSAMSARTSGSAIIRAWIPGSAIMRAWRAITAPGSTAPWSIPCI